MKTLWLRISHISQLFFSANLVTLHAMLSTRSEYEIALRVAKIGANFCSKNLLMSLNPNKYKPQKKMNTTAACVQHLGFELPRIQNHWPKSARQEGRPLLLGAL